MARRTDELPDNAEDLRALDAALKCPVCGDRRRKTTSGWLCVRPGHTGVAGKLVFAERIASRLRRLRGEDEAAFARRVAGLVKLAEQEDRQLSKTSQPQTQGAK